MVAGTEIEEIASVPIGYVHENMSAAAGTATVFGKSSTSSKLKCTLCIFVHLMC
jgi:hypothetical protein